MSGDPSPLLWSKLRRLEAVMTILVCLALAACSDDQRERRHIGVWGRDDDSTEESEELTKATKDWPEKQRRIYAAFVRATADLATIEFTRDRIIIQMVVGVKEAPYTVRSSIGDDIILDVTDGDQKKEVKLTMEGADVMVTDMAAGKLVRLRKMY